MRCMCGIARTRWAWTISISAWQHKGEKKMRGWWTRCASFCADVAVNRPEVLVVTRRTARKNKLIDYVGEYHLELLLRLGALPIMVPVVPGTKARLAQYMTGMRGLLLVEGEDIEPKRYSAKRE